MFRSLLIAGLELKLYLKDKGELAFSLLLPIVVFALMYGAFGGQSIFNGTAYIVNEDNGTYSTRFVEQVDKLESLDVQLLSRSDAELKLERADLQLFLIIPDGFSDSLVSDKQAQLVFKQRGNGGQEGQIIASIIRGVAQEISQEIAVKGQVNQALGEKGIPQEAINTTVEKFIAKERQLPLISVKEELIGTAPDPVEQFLPGIITMFVLFAITLSARALVEERKRGTLERLLTTRLTVNQLFVGKFVAQIFRGFLQTFILLVLAYAVFRIFTPLSFLEVLAIAIIFAGAAGALGLFLAAIARTEDQATWMAVFLTMLMTILSGTFFPVPSGTFMETLSKISLNTYANTALKSIIGGGSLQDVSFEIAVMAAVAVAGLLISRLLFKALGGGK